MKQIVVIVFILLAFLLQPPFLFAQATPQPQSPPTVEYTNEFSVKDEPSTIISLLQTFISGFDSILGGFIFYTPDPLGAEITLKDGSVIPGVTKYRDTFNQIAIPILAIIIAIIAISKIGSENTQQLKSFFVRLFIVIALFITVPPILSYSIQFNNLLVNKISETQKFTGFLEDYFTKSNEEIASGKNKPEVYGIPSFDISLKSGIFSSLGKFVVQLMLFALTFIFLICGFIFIGFQFVIRFASLLFLGVIYPLVLPFALWEKNEHIVFTYIKSWFTFLIEQPAFVLGFAIATDIFTSILKSQGPSVGVLFFYTGFLFFLGSVNVLIAKMFGDGWSAASNNLSAALSYKTVMGSSPANRMVKGIQNAYHAFPRKYTKTDTQLGGNSRNHSYSSSIGSNQKYISSHKPVKADTVPPFSHDLGYKGLSVASVNDKQGIVSVSGETYRFDDKKNGLVSFYPNRLEAIEDGIPEQKLEKVTLDNKQFIDLSSFNKNNPNPHNINAMEEAKRQGREINYAFISQSSPPIRVKRFLELTQNRNNALGVTGVIVQRQANNGSDPVIRIYSHKNYEKRTHI